MGIKIFVGMPPPNVVAWIVKKAKTHVKYTAASGLPDWEGDIVGELTDSSVPNKSNAEVVEIGSHVISIGDWAFRNCSELTGVTVPDSVMNIGFSAFERAGITSITIGNGVTSIGSNAFYSCSGLTSIIIPNKVTSIGIYAFKYCSGLTSITIGSGITSIEDYAFEECNDLMSVTFSGKDKATVQGMANYDWWLPSGCIIHCTDGDITI